MNLIYIVLFIFYHFNTRLKLTALPNWAHPTPNHFWSKLKNEIKIAIKLSWFAINIMTNRDRVNGENSGTADCAKFNCCSPPLLSPTIRKRGLSQRYRAWKPDNTNRQTIRQWDKQSTKASTQLTFNSTKRVEPPLNRSPGPTSAPSCKYPLPLSSDAEPDELFAFATPIS